MAAFGTAASIGSTKQRWQEYDADKAAEEALRTVLGASATPYGPNGFASGKHTPMSGAHTPTAMLLLASKGSKGGTHFVPGISTEGHLSTGRPSSYSMASGLLSPTFISSSKGTPAGSGSQTPTWPATSTPSAVRLLPVMENSAEQASQQAPATAARNVSVTVPQADGQNPLVSPGPSSSKSLKLLDMKKMLGVEGMGSLLPEPGSSGAWQTAATPLLQSGLEQKQGKNTKGRPRRGRFVLKLLLLVGLSVLAVGAGTEAIAPGTMKKTGSRTAEAARSLKDRASRVVQRRKGCKGMSAA